mgnify:CR=1 FL=1
MVTLEDFSRVVGEIYASSINPDNWPAAMSAISRILNTTACVIYSGHGMNRSFVIGDAPVEVHEAYADHYHRLDFILDTVEWRVPDSESTRN